MTQVSANPTAKPSHHSRGESAGSTTTSLPATVPPVRLLVGLMLAAAAGSLLLAVRAPLVVTVLGLIAFGVLHNVLEIRYVAGRFAGLLSGRFLLLLLALCSGIALCRLTGQLWPAGSRYAEVAVGYLILGAGAWIGLRGGWRVVG